MNPSRQPLPKRLRTTRPGPRFGLLALWSALAVGGSAQAQDMRVPSSPAASAAPMRIPLPARPIAQTGRETPKAEGSRSEQLREAIEQANSSAPATSASSAKPGTARKPAPTAATPQFTFTVEPDKKAAPASRAAAKAAPTEAAAGATPAQRAAPAPSDDEVSRQYVRARAAALGAFASTPSAAAAVGIRSGARSAAPKPVPGEPPPWAYQGVGGPLSWGQLKPEFATCASGDRQSPIAIDDATALQGPAEPLLIDTQPSTGSVLHTGRTLQVDVLGDNTLTVRGTRYKLERLEFSHPAEERINGKGFAMGAHLRFRSADGQLAMVAVLLEPGTASPLIDQVWTYLPLDADDRVGLPAAGLDVKTLMPQDPRYYQFFGSLTTPPCTEDVLWIVFKQPMTLSASQLKLFGQLFPNNARPLQPANGRVVRAAE